ncbi:MAG: ATP-binding cassette domain-containing protein [Proteobacteria bacterium]|nr:ATP-binding cassette domain-containing protein [Pseudomonadota bacterium]
MALLHLKNIVARISEHFTLTIKDWTFAKGENWLVTGPNASGKSVFGRLLTRQVDFSGDFIVLSRAFHEKISYMSPELEKKLFFEEVRNDDSEFIEGGFDIGRTAMEMIYPSGQLAQREKDQLDRWSRMFHIRHILHKGFRFLSAGETRKVLIIKALMQGPEILILDNPYAGLDIESREVLEESVTSLILSGVQIILIVPPFEAIPKGINRVICFENGEVRIQGDRECVCQSDVFKQLFKRKIRFSGHLPAAFKHESAFDPAILVKMVNVSVSYNGQTVFENMTWTFKKGEHWSIVGPNGAGKSTVLSMISGDNPKAYGRDLWIFERKRGTGESIWDIKKHLGIVSGDFHRNYRIGTSLLHVVISGFFDSIGIYDIISPEQIKIAKKWLSLAGLSEDADMPFDQLSFGQQRMALILRAMVKHPCILILDEPCQGLDLASRQLVLDWVDFIAESGNTHILHVTHDPSETLHCITNILRFVKKENGVYKTISSNQGGQKWK